MGARNSHSTGMQGRGSFNHKWHIWYADINSTGYPNHYNRIGKCHSGLCNSIVFWNKTTSCIHSSRYPHTSSHYLSLCSALRVSGPSCSSMIWYVALLHVISRAQYGTVSYRLCIVLRKILRWNLPLHSVLYNAHWRSSSLVKNLERQWRNGWCLTRRLAISLTS